MTYLLILIAIVVGVYIIYWGYSTVKRENEKRMEALVDDCRQRMVARIRKKGVENFNLSAFCEENDIESSVAVKAGQEIYAFAVKTALKDGQVRKEDEKQLAKLANSIGLSEHSANTIADQVKVGKYKDALVSALASGAISDQQSDELQRLRRTLGISSKQISVSVSTTAKDAYVALFREVISDWKITNREIEELKKLREATGLTKSEANDLIFKDAMKIFREWFTNAIQDGEVTNEEIEMINWCKNEFDLDSSEIDSMMNRIQHVNRLAAYREGELPVVTGKRLLEGGEICHWDSSCQFEWETQTQSKSADGELIVTSNQIVFNSPIRSFSFSPSKIIDILVFSNAIEIKTSSSRGTGRYYTKRADELEAIIVGIVKKHKYNLSRTFESDQSRHIPPSVRREVWARDCGQCVQCSADDYLEYDHIIPHSRGGANSVNNVQLLCRRCNLAKSDRI